MKRDRCVAAISVFDLWHLFAAARVREREQWMHPQRIAERRARRLQRLAAAACRASYYRELFRRSGVAPDTLNEESLEQLPVLEKAALHPSVASETITDPGGKLFAVTTSGSPGLPFRSFAAPATKLKFRPFGPASLSFTGVARWQVRQSAPDELRILVVPTRHWNDGSADAMAGSLRVTLGEGVRYAVEAVDGSPLTPGGKFQTIVPFE